LNFVLRSIFFFCSRLCERGIGLIHRKIKRGHTQLSSSASPASAILFLFSDFANLVSIAMNQKINNIFEFIFKRVNKNSIDYRVKITKEIQIIVEKTAKFLQLLARQDFIFAILP
jgi:hypothetical protein